MSKGLFLSPCQGLGWTEYCYNEKKYWTWNWFISMEIQHWCNVQGRRIRSLQNHRSSFIQVNLHLWTSSLCSNELKCHLKCCHLTNILNQSEFIKCGGVTDWVSTDETLNERNPLSNFSSVGRRRYGRGRSKAKDRKVLWRSSRPAHATKISDGPSVETKYVVNNFIKWKCIS